MSTSGIIYVSPVIFTTEQINKINQEIQKKFIANNTLDDSSAPAPGKKAIINKISCMDMMEFVYPFIGEMRKVNMDLFGYDVYFYLESDSFNYNVYNSETKDEYYWHTDGTEFGEASDIKLTGILNLSQDSYEGGDFLIFPHSFLLIFCLGLILPSFFNLLFSFLPLFFDCSSNPTIFPPLCDASLPSPFP